MNNDNEITTIKTKTGKIILLKANDFPLVIEKEIKDKTKKKYEIKESQFGKLVLS